VAAGHQVVATTRSPRKFRDHIDLACMEGPVSASLGGVSQILRDQGQTQSLPAAQVPPRAAALAAGARAHPAYSSVAIPRAIAWTEENSHVRRT
jgi:hypothetical protein